MTLNDAIEKFIRDRRAEGGLTTAVSIDSYRRTISLHVEDCAKRGHLLLVDVDRDDILETLDRWENTSTKRTRRSTLVGFYDWAVITQRRTDNPARQTRGPRRNKSERFIPSVAEIQRLLAVARQHGNQDWWAMELLAGTGLRNSELRGLRVRDLIREGFVHVPEEIGKNGKARWVPAPEPVKAVARQVIAERDLDDFVIGARQTVDHRNLGKHANAVKGGGRAAVRFDPTRPMSGPSLMRLVQRMVAEADVSAKITPQTLRRFVGSRATKLGSIYIAQSILGHESIATTVEHYVGIATDEETEQIRDAFSRDLGWPGRDDEPATAGALVAA